MMSRNRLMRSNSDYVFLGVCGGIADALMISSFIVRLVFILVPVSPILYLILAALMEKDDSFYGDSEKKKSIFKTALLAFIFTSIVFVIFLNLGLV